MSVLLIDLSNLVHREFAVRGQGGDIHATANAVVAQVRRLAHGQPHVAICCDSGKSFRKALADDYKANRGERDPAIYHQMQRAIDQLAADGFPVWKVPEMEADDLIATATTRLLAQVDADGLPAHDVLIVSSDKDLTQLVGPFVAMKRPDTGDLVDPDAVVAKFGVRPEQMGDYLALVGDSSDNIHGARQVGPKTAAALLARFGTLDELYTDLAKTQWAPDALKALGIKPALAESLQEFDGRRALVRQLIALRTDVDVPVAEVFAPRVPVTVATYNPEDDYPEEPMPDQQTEIPSPAPVVEGTIEPEPRSPAPAVETKAVEVRAVPSSALVPMEYSRALDPRDTRDARIIAKDLFESNMFSGYGSPQAVLSTIMFGRELGLPAMTSLRGIHNIDGKHALSAQLMVALVLDSGKAEYFELLEVSDTAATFETKRVGARNPQRVTYTLDQAQKAGLVRPKSNWEKDPQSMLVARAQSRLCRLVYPDVVLGLYTPEELQEAA